MNDDPGWPVRILSIVAVGLFILYGTFCATPVDIGGPLVSDDYFGTPIGPYQ